MDLLQALYLKSTNLAWLFPLTFHRKISSFLSKNGALTGSAP
jgi:hypothetical protein